MSQNKLTGWVQTLAHMILNEIWFIGCFCFGLLEFKFYTSGNLICIIKTCIYKTGLLLVNKLHHLCIHKSEFWSTRLYHKYNYFLLFFVLALQVGGFSCPINLFDFYLSISFQIIVWQMNKNFLFFVSLMSYFFTVKLRFKDQVLRLLTCNESNNNIILID